jgi:hypothetical protein
LIDHDARLERWIVLMIIPEQWLLLDMARCDGDRVVELPIDGWRRRGSPQANIFATQFVRAIIDRSGRALLELGRSCRVIVLALA